MNTWPIVKETRVNPRIMDANQRRLLLENQRKKLELELKRDLNDLKNVSKSIMSHRLILIERKSGHKFGQVCDKV